VSWKGTACSQAEPRGRPARARQVTNSAELLEALQDVARNLGLRVRPYTATPRAPFASYVAAMARTGVLVARHGPLLANAAFLPPGARPTPAPAVGSAWTRALLGLYAQRCRRQRGRRLAL
jgi:capsular polysaccharide biosynthesis protein